MSLPGIGQAVINRLQYTVEAAQISFSEGRIGQVKSLTFVSAGIEEGMGLTIGRRVQTVSLNTEKSA